MTTLTATRMLREVADVEAELVDALDTVLAARSVLDPDALGGLERVLRRRVPRAFRLIALLRQLDCDELLTAARAVRVEGRPA